MSELSRISHNVDMAVWTPYKDAIRWRRLFRASVALNVVLAAALVYFTR